MVEKYGRRTNRTKVQILILLYLWQPSQVSSKSYQEKFPCAGRRKTRSTKGREGGSTRKIFFFWIYWYWYRLAQGENGDSKKESDDSVVLLKLSDNNKSPSLEMTKEQYNAWKENEEKNEEYEDEENH